MSVYIDDIIMFSQSLSDHLRHLQKVFEWITEVGLKLKPAKCKFGQNELECLGHIASRNGLKSNPRLVEVVREFPTPKFVQETR